MRYEFQSLFFWNSRPDVGERLQPVRDHIVSILVFLELAPGRDVASRASSGHPGFNPCFSGTRARTRRKDKTDERERSFNPCFSGTRARTSLPR